MLENAAHESKRKRKEIKESKEFRLRDDLESDEEKEVPLKGRRKQVFQERLAKRRGIQRRKKE